MNLIAGYEIERFMVRTRLSRLYQGWDRHVQRRVVIKLFAVDPHRPVPPFGLEQWRNRFRTEGVALARLDHPNILPVLQGGVVGAGRPYLVLPYMSANLPGLIGFDVEPANIHLADEREKPKALAVPQTVQVLGQLFAALLHLHGRGMVHRDVKPQNVLLTSRQALGVRLCDFGMVKLGEETDLLPGEWIGTPSYMAPEQRQDARQATGQSDVYSACVLGFRLLTGFLPSVEPPVPPRVPPDLMALLRQGMVPDPSHRPTARQMLDHLLQMRPHIQ